MKPYVYLFFLFMLLPAPVFAGEWDFSYSGHIQGLYGYNDLSKRFKHNDKSNHGVGQGDVGFTVQYTYDDDYSASLNLDVMGGVDQELEDYNQGRWGEEAYLIADSPYGRLMLGQTFNVDAQFHEGAPTVGALANNNDVVDFISNPNWKRNGKITRFATLNTTYINTDGVAPKISYISPAFYDTMIGFTYVPDAYNRRGLVNKFASYEKDGGFVAGIYNASDLGFADAEISFGYAEFHDNDKEMSASLSLSRGGWTLGGGWRKTYTDGRDKSLNAVTSRTPELFDNYREGLAWNIGIGYEIGPYQTALSYFESKASRTDNRDKVIVFSNQYQLDEHMDVYLAAAHVDFEGKNSDIENNNQGYAFVAGIGLNF